MPNKSSDCGDAARRGKAGTDVRPLRSAFTLSPARVVFCTSGGIHGSLVLDRLLACGRIRLVGVVLSSRILRPRYSPMRGALEQIRTSGARYALYLWTATTLADYLLTWSGQGSVWRKVRRINMPRRITRDINGADEQQFLRDLRPDLLISAFFNQRLSQPVFSIPRARAVNIHPSLLPEYRGVDPVFFARLHGARTLGVTVHRIDSDFDTGDILFSEAAYVHTGESVLNTSAKLFRRGAELVTEHIDVIADGAPGSPQPPYSGKYDSWPTPSQAAALRAAGTALCRFSDLRAIATGRWSGV